MEKVHKQSAGKKIAYIVTPMLALALGLTSIASAHGGFGGNRTDFTPEERTELRAEHRERMLEFKADILGISVDELESALDEGMTFIEIAQEQGIGEEEFRQLLFDAHRARLQERFESAEGSEIGGFGKKRFHRGFGVPQEN